MYPSLKLAWSEELLPREQAYRAAGYVKTKGTLYMLPPSEEILCTTFNAPPRPKTRMSAGAVALCKHFERGGSSSEHGRPHPFWALPVGSNENKTAIAGQLLDKMLAQAVWKNVMLLHPGVAVYEIRNPWGYGMRWTLEVEEADTGQEQECVGEVQAIKTKTDLEKDWRIVRTTFRGFLEPILGMDGELPEQKAAEVPVMEDQLDEISLQP